MYPTSGPTQPQSTNYPSKSTSSHKMKKFANQVSFITLILISFVEWNQKLRNEHFNILYLIEDCLWSFLCTFNWWMLKGPSLNSLSYISRSYNVSYLSIWIDSKSLNRGNRLNRWLFKLPVAYSYLGSLKRCQGR